MGQVVVITGAASGIGRATALRFARTGAKVHVCDLNAAGASGVVDEIAAAGGTAVAHTVDVADATQLEALAERVFDQDGAVDLLHNNAGVGTVSTFDDLTLTDWRRVIEIDLFGVIHGVHAFAPRMLGQGRCAVIVNTASMAGLIAFPYGSPYATSKYGVVGLSESLDMELGPRGVRVCAVCPGMINTPAVNTVPQGLVDPERGAAIFARFGADPDVVAKAVERLAEHPRVIVTVPRWHVAPLWGLKRIAPRAHHHAVRLLFARLIAAAAPVGTHSTPVRHASNGRAASGSRHDP